jgi:hypothetical protein
MVDYWSLGMSSLCLCTATRTPNQPTDAVCLCVCTGVLLFEMLTGRPPFRGPSNYKLFEVILGSLAIVSVCLPVRLLCTSLPGPCVLCLCVCLCVCSVHPSLPGTCVSVSVSACAFCLYTFLI